MQTKVSMKDIIHPALYLCLKIRYFATLLIGALLLVTQPAASIGLLTPFHLHQAECRAEEKSQPKHGTASYISTQSKDMTRGYWYSQQTRDKYCIKFREDDSQSWGWSMSRCFDKTVFEKKQNEVFQYKKETGTLTLTGKLYEEKGEGTYVFTKDDSFSKYLSDNNIQSKDENLMFHLYLSDVDKQYIEFLKKQYTQISGDRLLELAIHGVSIQNYQAYIDLFEKYSNKKPTMQEVIEAKIHGIEAEYVEMIQASGYKNLSMRKMMETKIHGVDAAYIDMLKKEGFASLSIDQVLSAKIHGISPAFVREIRSLGYTDLGLEKMMEAKIHGVSSTYVQELEKAGFTNLPINKLIEAKIHGVNAQFIDEAKSKGYKLESINQYIDLKIHGLSRTSIKN
jgi:hypothetical protein